jgi:polysaccharide chain length determinant protein (PEP-CTERM system associated)
MSEGTIQLDQVIKGLWRYRWSALAVAAAVTVLGSIVVFALPNIYEARARVYVDTKTVLRPLLQGITPDDDGLISQLNQVRQALASGPNLERVASAVYPDFARMGNAERQGILYGISEQLEISIETQRDPRIPNTLYRINYRDSDRERALQVTQVLVDAFVADALDVRREGGETAQDFLRDQIAEYEMRLREAETQLADFKTQNFGLVPGADGDFFQRLQNEMTQVKNLESALTVAQNRRAALQRQRSGENRYMPGSSGASSSPSSSATTANTGSAVTTSRILETQARLDELLLQYTEKHPEVISARQTLADLQRRQAQEIEAMNRGDFSALAASGATTNPIFQSIQTALNQADVDIAAIQGELATRRRNVAELRRVVDTAPDVEARYAALTRDYDVTRTQYRMLLERLERAKVTEDADQTGAMRFNVIDPPSASMRPLFPNRPIFLLGVLVAGLGAGAGLAFLRAQSNKVFEDTQTLARITGVQVFGISHGGNIDERESQKRRELLQFAAAAAVLVVITGAAVRFHSAGAYLLHQAMG